MAYSVIIHILYFDSTFSQTIFDILYRFTPLVFVIISLVTAHICHNYKICNKNNNNNFTNKENMNELLLNNENMTEKNNHRKII